MNPHPRQTAGRPFRTQRILAGMTADPARWSDLVSEMYVAVMEEAHLHEITRGTTDLLGAGRRVVHGPWSAEECQSVLLPWHSDGWLELISDADPTWSPTSAAWQVHAIRHGAFLVLPREDASRLLNDPARWVLGTADGPGMLCGTDEGDSHTYSKWLGLAERAKGRA